MQRLIKLKKILIVDFGSQFTQLIARRIRELGVFSEIISHKDVREIDQTELFGIILSGGPLNVYQDKKIKLNKKIFDSKCPILGICFGHQIISKFYGGKVKSSKFLFQRNIVFNPKNADSYLYLAKIFKSEDNKEEEEKNLDTTLLLEPDNEEAIYMLINIQLDRSNFDKVNILMNRFSNVCKKMCNKKLEISKSLQDFEANNAKTN